MQEISVLKKNGI